jgi:hypothetical protein
MGNHSNVKGMKTKRDRDMFGVVLWSDEQEKKAVIWCEDHGDLAFYRNTDGTTQPELDAGDWVQFDMTMECRQRFAHNPRLVHEGVYPDLADALCAAPLPEQKSEPAPAKPALPSQRASAEIIPFARQQISRRRKAAGALCINGV